MSLLIIRIFVKGPDLIIPSAGNRGGGAGFFEDSGIWVEGEDGDEEENVADDGEEVDEAEVADDGEEVADDVKEGIDEEGGFAIITIVSLFSMNGPIG